MQQTAEKFIRQRKHMFEWNSLDEKQCNTYSEGGNSHERVLDPTQLGRNNIIALG